MQTVQVQLIVKDDGSCSVEIAGKPVRGLSNVDILAPFRQDGRVIIELRLSEVSVVGNIPTT